VKAATDWAECNAAIDILFINATADYEALHSDLSHWSPFVKLGGVVILQGSSPELPKYLQPPRYSDVRHIDSLAWGVKQCASSVAVQTIEARPQTDIATARHQDYIRRSIREVAENRHAIRELHRSWSWRLTAPLRWGGNVSQAISGLIASLGQGASGARIAGLKQWLLYRNRVRASGLFDERYYRDQHPSVAWARNSPLLHFFVCGAGERNSPNELFDVDYYLRCYPEVAQSCANPLVHYLNTGAYEGKNPHPYFDSSFYLEQNPDVRESRINPLAHYLAPGIAEGRDPNPWFDTSDYLDKNVDVVTFGLNPLTHYLCSR